MADKQDYYRKNRLKIIGILILLVVTAVIGVYSISVTQYYIPFFKAIDILIDHLNHVEPTNYTEWIEDRLVCEKLVPRAIGGIAVGAILGVCGTIMQSTIRNPLADPYTTGISSGALLGVTLFTIFDISVIPVNDTDLGLIVSAFMFALIPCAIILGISLFKSITSNTMILIGIAVMYVFNAISTLFRYTATDDDVASIYAWAVGSLGKIDWTAVFILVIVFVLIFAFGVIYARKINILSADDRLCKSLGINPSKSRILCLILVAIATAAAVCFVGTIGFVGLVAPHIARIFIGSDNRYLIPASAVVGGCILIAADTYARVATFTGLPVGVITSLIGGPIFLLILLRQRKSAWGS